MLEGFKLTLMGMLTVFVFLGLLVGVIQLIGYFLKPQNSTSPSPGPALNPNSTVTPPVLAAISAAVATYEAEERK